MDIVHTASNSARSEQWENAATPIAVTPSGIVIDSKPEHSLNADTPISRTGRP